MILSKTLKGILLPLLSILIIPFLANAEEFTAGQTRTFVVSAYYSPLPNQDAYVWGSYENDIYVNGQGLRGADFTKVYPGMLAAPSSYPFGTKIYIPGIGTGTVHDRGGKITAGHSSDRIDVWMGWGDDGRKRALQWGMKTKVGTIQAWSTTDKVEFSVASYDSQVQNIPEKTVLSTNTTSNQTTNTSQNNTSNILQLKDYNDSVTNLQKFLKQQGFFTYEPTGYYGEKTEESVYQFQKHHGLVGNKNSPGAGIFGPKTRKKLEELWGNNSVAKITSNPTHISKLSTQKNIEIYIPQVDPPALFALTENNNSDVQIYAGIGKTDSGDHVALLQTYLKKLGYLHANATGYFGPLTEDAILQFQIDNNIVSKSTDAGAGRFGPKTYAVLSKKI